MALAFTTPDGPPSSRVDLLTPTGRQTAVMALVPDGPLSVDGQQTAWRIDPFTGNDANAGTPAAPLRTMAAFNARQASLLVTVAQTLELVGDVIDAPLWLRGTSYAAGASLTVSGTVTTIGTATISVVTGLNPASATLQPWQLQTTGIDWTTVPIGSRLLLSNGSLGFIRNVIDANNVVCGAFCTTATASVVPVAALTITVQSLSRALPPNVQIQALDSTVVLTVRDASFDAASGLSCTAAYQNNVLVFGCEMKTVNANVISSVVGLALRGCRITLPNGGSAAIAFRSAVGFLNFTSCVFSAPATSTFIGPNAPGSTQMQHACIFNSQLIVQQGAYLQLSTSFNLQNNATAVLVDSNGVVNAGIAVITGSAGAGIGLDVRWGMLCWNGLANRPTITGGSDCRVAGVTYTYAALGSGKTASIIPVTAPPTPVVNTDPNRGPGIASICQSA